MWQIFFFSLVLDALDEGLFGIVDFPEVVECYYFSEGFVWEVVFADVDEGVVGFAAGFEGGVGDFGSGEEEEAVFEFFDGKGGFDFI